MREKVLLIIYTSYLVLIRWKEDSAVKLTKTQAELKFLPVTGYFQKLFATTLLESPTQEVPIPPEPGEPQPLNFSDDAPQVHMCPGIVAVGASYLLFALSKQVSNKAAY